MEQAKTPEAEDPLPKAGQPVSESTDVGKTKQDGNIQQNKKQAGDPAQPNKKDKAPTQTGSAAPAQTVPVVKPEKEEQGAKPGGAPPKPNPAGPKDKIPVNAPTPVKKAAPVPLASTTPVGVKRAAPPRSPRYLRPRQLVSLNQLKQGVLRPRALESNPPRVPFATKR